MLLSRQIINCTALELEIVRVKTDNILNDINMLKLVDKCMSHRNQEAIPNEVVKPFKYRNSTHTYIYIYIYMSHGSS